jgi:hypothetical protein
MRRTYRRTERGPRWSRDSILVEKRGNPMKACLFDSVRFDRPIARRSLRGKVVAIPVGEQLNVLQ